MTTSYEDRLLRVLAYIHDNPDGDLSLDRLADEAAMSRFHWHRVFRAMTGETCAQAVRRVRLYQAATQLVQTTMTTDRIALACGYPNAKSFARAFSETFGQTPKAFRERGQLPRLRTHTKERDHTMYKTEIVDQPARLLAVLPHHGAYNTIARSFDQLSGLFSARALWEHAQGMISVSCDDPDVVPEAELRSYAGISIDETTPVDAPLVSLRLPAGKHAVLRYIGPYAGIKEAYDHLYGTWLPGSGQEPADAWPFEVYHNTPLDTAPEDLHTDICVPLK